LNTKSFNKNCKNFSLKVREKMYTFKECETLTSCIIMLYRIKNIKYIGSSLYKTDDSYNLIVTYSKFNNIDDLIKSICDTFTEDYDQIAIIKEYGRKLIQNNAIGVYGKAFNPGF